MIKPSKISAILAASLLSLSSPAALLVYEPFSPTSGLTTNLLKAAATGTGLSGTWTASTGDAGSATVILRAYDPGSFFNGWPDNVSFPAPAGRVQLQDAAWSWKTLTRAMASPINVTNAGTYFLTWLMHDYGNNNYDFRPFLGNSASGLRIYLGHGYGGRLIGIGNSTTRPWDNINMTTNVSVAAPWPACTNNQMVFAVAQITCNGAGGLTIKVKHYAYDPVAQMGDSVDVNPATATWEATCTGAFSGTFDQLGLSGGCQNASPEISEIRLGTNWSEVMNVAPTTGLINVALGPLPAGQTVYSGYGPATGTAADVWNAVALASSGSTTYAPVTSATLKDSAGNPTAVTVQVGTSGAVAKSWNTSGAWGGELGALVTDYVVFWGQDAIVVRGLDPTKSYNLYCFNGPWDGTLSKIVAGGITKSMTTYGSWITPWRETQQFVAFTNLTTDASGNLNITVGPGNNASIGEALCGFQLQAVPARFVTQPQNQIAPLGGTVKFSAVTLGGRGTPTFRWQQNVGGAFTNLSDVGNIFGATNSTLAISNVAAMDAGNYRAVVTIGALVTNSATANLTVQSGTITANLTADLTTVYRNPFMGWVIYASDNGDIPNADSFWNQVATPFLPYATTCYIRLLWSQMEPQEGVYAWNNDTNFMALVQGATSRGIKLAFRVYVNSQDVPQQATPQWAFNAGIPVIATNTSTIWTNGANTVLYWPEPDIRNAVFQNKYATFINAFGAAFNDPSKVAFVDASTFGQWGEMNVGSGYMTSASDRAQTMQWLCNTYSNAFTRVPSAMNFPGGTWSDSEIDNYCFNTGCTVIRRDGIGPYGWVNTTEQAAIQVRWPGIPFIAEEASFDPTPNEEVVVIAQSLYLHANFLDLREPYSAGHKVGNTRGLVNNFSLYGGYRFSVGAITYPGILQANSNVVFQATMQNWGAGMLPNHLKPWNYKYKFAYALLDASGNPVATIVDTAPADDPSNWTNGTAYVPPLTAGIPSDLMGNYWQVNSKIYTLKVTNNFGNVAAGNYYLGVAIIDTSNTNRVDISLANTAPRAASGWTLVGPVIVGAAPAITAQPQSQIVPQGATVQLSVTANGTPTPAFRWKNSNVNLADGATGNGSALSGSAANTLTIVNAQPTDGGIYSVGVTNLAGGTNSSPAQLLVVPPPTADQSPWLTNTSTGSQFGLTFGALPGYRYLVQRSTDLGLSANWVTLTNLPPAFSNYWFYLADSFTNPAAFYRTAMTNQ